MVRTQNIPDSQCNLVATAAVYIAEFVCGANILHQYKSAEPLLRSNGESVFEWALSALSVSGIVEIAEASSNYGIVTGYRQLIPWNQIAVGKLPERLISGEDVEVVLLGLLHVFEHKGTLPIRRAGFTLDPEITTNSLSAVVRSLQDNGYLYRSAEKYYWTCKIASSVRQLDLWTSEGPVAAQWADCPELAQDAWGTRDG